MSTESPRVRIARLLLSFASSIGKDGPQGTEILVGNDELAGGTGLTRYTITRVLKQWKRDGIVMKRRGMIVLRRPELLLPSYREADRAFAW